jgi:hypothetical protein
MAGLLAYFLGSQGVHDAMLLPVILLDRFFRNLYSSNGNSHCSSTLASSMESMKRIIIAVGCIAFLGGCSPPNDATMISRFNDQKAVLETLVQMVEGDKFAGVVWVSDSHDKPTGISKTRTMEYQRLLRQVGLRGIMRADAGTAEHRIIFFTPSVFLSSEEKNYVFSRNTLSPLLESLDKGRHEFKPYLSYYKQIEKYWYLEFANVNG